MEVVRFKLEEIGAATTQFEAPLGLKSRIEIRRVTLRRAGMAVLKYSSALSLNRTSES